MSDVAQLLVETADQIFERWRADAAHDADAGWSPELWQTLEDLGMTRVGLSEEEGDGGTLRDVATLVRVAARHAAPIPLAETLMLAGRLLGECSLPIPPGPLTAAAPDPADLRVRQRGESWCLDGLVWRVPWGRHAARVVLLVTDRVGPVVVSLDPAQAVISPGENLAGEPRDDLALDGVVVRGADAARAGPRFDATAFDRRLALARSVQMSGAAQRVLGSALQHTKDRVQFGRPIASFQAVQHQLAELAGEVTAMTVSSDAAVEAAVRATDDAEDGERSAIAVAAAKANASASAGHIAALGHQLHGAMGFTHEHPLHLNTTRLWSWREEGGNEAHWGRQLGALASDPASPSLWELIVGG